MTLKPQDSLAHYRLVEVLGQGGMGVVWKAEDTKLDRHVALKVLPPERVGDEERRLRFLREARTAAAVSHPSIAPVYEIGEAGETIFIAMELVEGETLRARLADGRLSTREVLRSAVEIAEALASAVVTLRSYRVGRKAAWALSPILRPLLAGSSRHRPKKADEIFGNYRHQRRSVGQF